MQAASMLVPVIVVTEAPSPDHQHQLLSESTTPSRLRKTFGFAFRKKSEERTSRSRSPSPLRILLPKALSSPSSKRKDTTSPAMLKRKYLRKVKLPPLTQVNSGNKTTSEQCDPESPSIFEEELTDNDSPNDPEFVRRTAERWQRKTGAAQPPLQLLPTVRVQQPSQVWPSSPSQQSAFRRRVSPRPLQHLIQSPFLSAPASPVLGSTFSRGSPQYSSMGSFNHSVSEQNFVRGSQAYSSLGLQIHHGSKSLLASSTFGSSKASFHLSPIFPRKSAQLSPTRPRKGSLSLSPNTHRKGLYGINLSPFTPRKSSLQPPSPHPSEGDRNSWSSTALDDTVTAEVRRQHMRELVGEGLTAPFLRLSVRIRRSFRRTRHKECTSSLHTSASCHTNLLHLPGCTPPASPSSIPRSASLPPDAHNFGDIFLEEPELAHKFAIMFPSEPRPEWHRHLRQVIHKAGQKVFKKPDSHDTNIPENLRHQLKHIYVY